MTRLTRTLRFGAVALLLLGAAGAGLAQHVDAAGTAKLVQSAEQGDAEAQFQLGFMHGCGFGGFEQDTAGALTWYRRSAEQGFAAAQSALGTAYAYGEPVEKDYAEAARWCRLAAEQGDSDGQFCLALLYANGAGVEQDDAESVKWLRLAGDQGEGMAQARLGDLYAAGEGGVRRDPVEADKWYRLATRTDVEVTVMAGQEFTSGREILFHLLVVGELYRDGFGLPRDDVGRLQVAGHRGALAAQLLVDHRDSRRRGSPDRADPPPRGRDDRGADGGSTACRRHVPGDVPGPVRRR